MRSGKVCVLGGSGFLGSHVADALSDAGYEVSVFDRNPSSFLRPGQSMILGSITEPDDLDRAISGAQYVYNFAAIADLNEGLDRPAAVTKANVLGNTLVLDACVRHGVSRFVYASSIYVNSREGGFYRCSKQAAESFTEEYKRAFGLDYTILRYGSLYGPRSGPTNGLYRIVREALETGVVRYRGSANASREYIHVQDAARASVAILTDKFRDQKITLTGQQEMRVIDLLEVISEILGCRKPPEFIEDPSPGHYVRTPYSFDANPVLKFTPDLHVDLGLGLLQLMEEIVSSRSSD